jgi:hypothetical protein
MACANVNVYVSVAAQAIPRGCDPDLLRIAENFVP